jgi:hypothetical protein
VSNTDYQDPGGGPGAGVSLGGLPEPVRATRAAVGDDDLAAILSTLLGVEPSAENMAAFKADNALMGLVNQLREKLATQAQVERAKEVAREQPPDEWIGGWGPGNAFGRQRNPEYAAHQKRVADARALLGTYYQYGEPDRPELQPYKTLQTQTEGLKTRITSRVAAVQQDAKEAAAKAEAEAEKRAQIVWLPTGSPGEERAHTWDAKSQAYVPANDAQGNPLPTRKTGAAATPRVAEGTQSWEPKELTLPDGRTQWYQVPVKARADGSWEPDTSRMPQPMQGMPSGGTDVTLLDGVPHTRTGPDGSFVPVPGYVKPPMTRTDAQGRGYYSTDGGVTWQASSGLPGTPQTISSGGVVYPLDENGLPLVDRGVRLPQGAQPQTVDGYLVEVDPVTKRVSRTDLYTPEQRARLERAQGLEEETAGVNLETARGRLEQARALQDPVAEYQRQVQVSQQKATTYRDQLNQKVLEGQLSVEDASSQFDTWWDSNVEASLTPFRTMAEASYRREANEYQRAQAAEQARVDAINRQREQTAYAAGEKARQDLMTLAPQGRSPEFLNQLAQNVSRIGEPLPGGVTQHHGGMRFSPESLSLDAVKASQPSITQVGQTAVARALAQISPAAAQSVGAPPPQVPGLPQFQDFASRAPFSIPNPALPVPGQEALDLGNPANAGRLGLPVQPGYAGTRYQGGRVEPWLIPAG